jgi:methylglyoxal synthase
MLRALDEANVKPEHCMKTKVVTLHQQKRVALIAHDNKKQELSDWAVRHKELLANHRLCATGTTGYKVEKDLGLPVEKLISGPLGGDQQIGSRIPTGEVDVLIFFWDPFEAMPHDPDIKALLRIAAVWNIPVACNPASADFILNSPLFTQSYAREVPDYDSYIAERVASYS